MLRIVIWKNFSSRFDFSEKNYLYLPSAIAISLIKLIKKDFQIPIICWERLNANAIPLFDIDNYLFAF